TQYGSLNLSIANEIAGTEPCETIRLGIECVRASQTDRFRQHLAYRWRQHETVAAKAHGKKESRVFGMGPQNWIFVWRDVIVSRPPPLQVQRGTGGQRPLQLRYDTRLEVGGVPIEVEAGWLVTHNARGEQVIVGFGIVPEVHIARVDHHG